jgi:hypothetical protein
MRRQPLQEVIMQWESLFHISHIFLPNSTWFFGFWVA